MTCVLATMCAECLWSPGTQCHFRRPEISWCRPSGHVEKIYPILVLGVPISLLLDVSGRSFMGQQILWKIVMLAVMVKAPSDPAKRRNNMLVKKDTTIPSRQLSILHGKMQRTFSNRTHITGKKGRATVRCCTTSTRLPLTIWDPNTALTRT